MHQYSAIRADKISTNLKENFIKCHLFEANMPYHKGILFNLKQLACVQKESFICRPMTKVAISHIVNNIKSTNWHIMVNHFQSVDLPAKDFIETFIQIKKNTLKK